MKKTEVNLPRGATAKNERLTFETTTNLVVSFVASFVEENQTDGSSKILKPLS